MGTAQFLAIASRDRFCNRANLPAHVQLSITRQAG
jgi:hypothetical protein